MELTTFDPEIERIAKENLRLLSSFESESKKFVEMGELLGNGNPPRTLRELFAPITTNTPSFIACYYCYSF
jgi:hypothetical protein